MYKKSFIEYFDRYFLFLAGNFYTMGLVFVAVMAYVRLLGNVFIPLSGFIIFYSIYMFVLIGALYGQTDKTRNAFSLAFRGFLYGLANIVVFTVIISIIRFYSKTGAFGVIAGIIFIIILLVWVAGTLFVPYLLCLRGKGIVASFKYSFRMFFDRPAAGLVILLSYFFFAFASFTFFIGSSFAIGLVAQISRAYLIFDEYALAHPDENPDWKEIFAKDLQNIEDVNLKGLLFPWKKKIKK